MENKDTVSKKLEEYLEDEKFKINIKISGVEEDIDHKYKIDHYESKYEKEQIEKEDLAISKQVKEELKKQRRLLEKQKTNNRKLKFRKFIKTPVGKGIIVIAAGTILSLGALAAHEVKEYYNSDKYKISKLEDEIEIHSGHAIIQDTGKKITPYDSHGCAIGSKEVGTIDERIEIYCDENGLEDITDDAIRKFDLLYKDDPEGNEIDLYEIHVNNLENKNSNTLH